MPSNTEKTTAEKIRESQIASARDRAHVAVQRAEFIFAKAKGDEPNASEREELANAAESLNAYLAELER
jgi:hypothetical protein